MGRKDQELVGGGGDGSGGVAEGARRYCDVILRRHRDDTKVAGVFASERNCGGLRRRADLLDGSEEDKNC